MHVCIVSDFEIGSHRAHAINVVKTGGGFARLGHEVTLLCRASADGVSVQGAARMYGEPGLRWELAPALRGAARESNDERRQREFGLWAATRCAGAGLVYARHFEAGLAAAEAGATVALETHAYIGDESPTLQRAIDATQGPLSALVTISPRLRDHYILRGAEPGRVWIVPDGVDLAMFSKPAEPPAPPPPFERWSKRGHAVYAGHLYEAQGIPTIIDAAARVPEIGFELVGGTPGDIAKARQRMDIAGARNIRIHGAVEHAQVPAWLWGADALLLPPSASAPTALWMSPVKLGEYLASGVPIVASRIPGLMTWVGEPVVRWFQPDDAADLVRAVGEALAETPESGAMRRAAARKLAESLSYPRRAASMLKAVREGTKVRARAKSA